ncbi:GNAT family N-acetyltransferase [Inquilinus sp.]|jgi:ribosomal protein S18 acetylase RimI-like enzyme|uniref:GNAT family N-acetyltransferase n=1 Tax=Inquilinus sp. TaxID=1932117 RepID=UPI0037839081
MITVGTGTSDDLGAIEGFAEAAMGPAFDHPDLDSAQRAENVRIVGMTRQACAGALDRDDATLLVARDEATGPVGFAIVLRTDPAMPEIDWLIVNPSFHGRGAADALMREALEWIGPGVPVKLGVIHYNARAIAFYEKHGFRDTGRIVGRHAIPRRLMIRPAEDGSRLHN